MTSNSLKMKREQVHSSSIRAIGYDARKKVLEIEFNNGGTYQYFNVPARIYTALIHATSIGAYFMAAIRGYYPYARI